MFAGNVQKRKYQTLFLKDLPYIPDALQGMKLITVFMAEDIYNHLRFVEDYFCIRVYENLDELVVCDWKSEIMKAFPLVPQLVENDYPTWDGGGIPMDIEDEILHLEDEEMTFRLHQSFQCGLHYKLFLCLSYKSGS